MDALTKSMTGTAVGLGSIALVGESMKMIPKNMGMGKRKGKPVNFLKGSTNLMIGTAFLGGASELIK